MDKYSGKNGFNNSTGNESLGLNIAIALCTYNGERYLEEQLESLGRQSLAPAEVVVCDDQSTDGTLKILNTFKKTAPFPVRVYLNEERLGVVRNFSKAIELCKEGYVATCDQDDIWLPDRLAITGRAMRKAESEYGQDTPLLVHSDLKLADAGGNIIAPSFIKKARISFVEEEPLKNLLVQNFVTGSTVLVNRALLDAVTPIPVSAVMHDRWLALGAAALGRIISLAEPTVIYRQHECNLVGWKALLSSQTLKRLAGVDVLERDLAAAIKQGLAFRRLLAEKHDYNLPGYANLFLDKAQQSGPAAELTALRLKIGKKPWYMNVVFLLLLLKGGYRRYLEMIYG